MTSLSSCLSMEQNESDPKIRPEPAKTKTSKRTFFPITITLPAFGKESNLLSKMYLGFAVFDFQTKTI